MLELKPHQLKALPKMHNGCILTGDVGTGKSITALAYYYMHVAGGVPQIAGFEFRKMKRPRDVYIITTAKKRNDKDWELEAVKFGLGVDPDPINGVKVHVDSWNNIQKYDSVEGAFFIFDEQRLVGSGAWVKAFLRIVSKNLWILLSATPGDTWMDYIPSFVANGFYRNRTEFLRRHVVYSRFSKFPKVERYLETARLERLRRQLLVPMPYERHTNRHIEFVGVDYDNDTLQKVVTDRWHVYEDRPLKDVAEMYQVMRKVVNTDPSRLGELMKLIEKHPKLIIFYNFNYELEILRALAANLSYPVGEWNGQKHESIPTADKWLYLVQYTAGAEGWNCIETDSMAFWSLTYSNRVFEQSQGRTDRLNTPFKDLYYYVFRSSANIDKAIWKALTEKKEFNARAYTQKVWDSYTPF